MIRFADTRPRALTFLGVPDFSIYYQAVHDAEVGRKIYADIQVGRSFVYPPPALLLLWPFSAWDRSTSALVFAAVSVAAHVLSLLCVLSLLVGSSWSHRVMTSLIWLFFAPFFELLFIGQVNSLVLLAMVGCWYLHERRHRTAAGILLAVAVILKSSPIVLILFFLTDIELLIAFALTGAVLAAATCLWFEPSLFVSYVRAMAEIHSPGYMSVSPLRTLSTAWAKGIRALMLAALAALAVVSARSTRIRSSFELYALFLLVMTVVPPLVWYHHLIFLLPAITLILKEPTRSRALCSVGLLAIQGSHFLDRLNIPAPLGFFGPAWITANVLGIILITSAAAMSFYSFAQRSQAGN